MARHTPRADLPPGTRAYRQIGPFGQDDLPSGLLAQHRLAEGTWGVLTLEEGRIAFVWDDDAGGANSLVAPAEIVIPPQVLHHLEPSGAFRLSIAFHR